MTGAAIAQGAGQALPALVSGSAALAVLLLVVLHILRPDLDPSWHVVSEYANGPHGWLMTITFAALAAGCTAMVVLLLPVADSWPIRVGTILLALAATGLAMAALFPADIVQDPMPPVSWTGSMHSVASLLGNPTLLIGMLVLAFALPGYAPWEGTGSILLALAVIAWLSFIAMMVGLFVFLPQGTGGLGALVGYGNRLLVAAYAGWLIAASLPLFRTH
jgi:hypothetical protein